MDRSRIEIPHGFFFSFISDVNATQVYVRRVDIAHKFWRAIVVFMNSLIYHETLYSYVLQSEYDRRCYS
jgi:hypothetical protein